MFRRMSKGQNYRVKSQTPVSVIVHGGDYLGFLLAQTLIEQGSQVIIIDKYTSQSKKYTNQLKKEGNITFINFKSAKSFLDEVSRIDYLYYNLVGRLNENTRLESKDFLTETDTLNLALKSALKFKAKISLLTSLRLNRELANRVNNDNLSQPSAYSDIELQKYCENLAAEFRDQTNSNLRIIRLGTILGKGIEQISNPELHKLFSDGVSNNQIEIVGEGLDVHNIIEESDAVYGLLKLTFSDKTKGEVISLSNRTDYTTLSIAYKLLELNVTAQSIKFVTDENSKLVLQDLYVPAPNASKYGWKQQSSLENTLIDQIHKYFDLNNQKWDIPKESKAPEKVNTLEVSTKKGKLFNKIKNIFQRKSGGKFFEEINYKKIAFLSTLSILSLLFVYFLLSPVLGIAIGGAIISANSKDLQENIAEYNFDGARENLSNIKNHVSRVKDNSKRIDWMFSLLNNQNLAGEIDKIFLGLDYAIDSGDSLLTGLEPLALYIQDFEPSINFQSGVPNSTREYRDYLKSIEENSYLTADGAYKLTLANEVISTVVVEYFPNFAQDYVLELKSLSNQASQSVESINSVIGFIPDLLGNTERKRFLILLQNEGEIRSTGGWLSSYAIVGLEGGQIRELFVDDIYNADGTLKVQNKRFSPPNSLANALETTDYSFSLVNWDPDLYNVMLEAESFVEALGKGDDLDGIVTIDITFIQKLLNEWGGIEVPGESELVTSENIYSKIFEMHEEFTPGSDRKATFLANLANQTVTKLLSSNFSEYGSILSVFEESLNEKHLQAAFKNSDATRFFNNNNWDGQLDTKYVSAPIAIDWNWGANKANLYIKRDHNLDIKIEDTSITYTYEINVINESTSNTYPQGDYINYSRIYIPSGAKILNIQGIENNKYDIYNDSGFQVVGGWFNTPVGQNNTLVLRYSISKSALGVNFPLSIQNDNVFLDLNIFKQPGTKKESYVLSISHPTEWNVLESDELNAISNQLNRRFDLVSDAEFDVSWSTL
jgi:nucleoside-diphosphate-sugar epimerase